MRKIRPNKRQKTPKRVSNREIKSLGNIINTLKPQIVTEPKVATSSKIAIKPKKVSEKTLITVNLKIV